MKSTPVLPQTSNHANSSGPRRRPRSRARTQSAALIVSALAAFSALPAQTPPDQNERSGESETGGDAAENAVAWISGPATADIGEWAEITVPPGYRFAGEDDAYAAASGNSRPHPDLHFLLEHGYLEPVAENAGWYFVFSFDDYGYMPRETGGELDADLIRRSYETQFYYENEFTPAERDRLRFVSWKIRPRFTADGGAEWAAAFRNGRQGVLINYVRALPGRDGCLKAVAYFNEAEFDRRLPELRFPGNGLRYKAGRSYSDYEAGDPVSYVSLNEYLAGC